MKNVSPLEVCLSAQSFLPTRVQLRASPIRQGQRMITLAPAMHTWWVGRVNAATGQASRFSWWKARLLEPSPVPLPHLFSLAPVCACMSVCCICWGATLQMGKHFHVCLQLGLQESSEMERVGNHSSSLGFKLLPPKITRQLMLEWVVHSARFIHIITSIPHSLCVDNTWHHPGQGGAQVLNETHK